MEIDLSTGNTAVSGSGIIYRSDDTGRVYVTADAWADAVHRYMTINNTGNNTTNGWGSIDLSENSDITVDPSSLNTATLNTTTYWFEQPYFSWLNNDEGGPRDIESDHPELLDASSDELDAFLDGFSIVSEGGDD